MYNCATRFITTTSMSSSPHHFPLYVHTHTRTHAHTHARTHTLGPRASVSAVRVHLTFTLLRFLRGRFGGFVPFLRVF